MNITKVRSATPFIFTVLIAVTAIHTLAAAEWPEFRGAGRQGIWREDGVIEQFDKPVLEPLWTAPVGGGYSGPTVDAERVYVMDRVESDESDRERILCFDRVTGSELWRHAYPCRYVDIGYPLGPRASVTVKDGRVFSMGTMGDFRCLDAETGRVIWEKNFREEYEISIPIWGITSSPLVEGGNVIVQVGGADGACVVALDRESGDEVWRAFDDKPSYVSPVMIEQAGQRILVVWTGFRLAGMDAATGAVRWEHPTKPHRMPINVPGPAIDAAGEHLFLTTFYDGSRLLRLRKDAVEVEEVWSRKGVSETKTDALHSMISPPFIDGEHIYGVDSYGELRCLDRATGDRVWESLDAAVPTGRWSTIFMVREEARGRTWMFNEKGELIIAKLTPAGFEEISRAQLIEPTTFLKRRGANVVWSQPAFAHRCVFARNDRELVCVSLAE